MSRSTKCRVIERKALTPYIVTTKRPSLNFLSAREEQRMYIVARHAVITLEQAREYIRCNYLTGFTAVALTGFDALPASGGTVGPLPDGTVIEVERRGWEFFGWNHVEPPMPDQLERIVRAYNAREAKRHAR